MGFLSDAPLGSIVTINENGMPHDFYVAAHGYPTAGSGRTLLVRRYIHSTQQWNSNNSNAYASSGINTWLTSGYLGLFSDNIQTQIAAVSIPYTQGAGSTATGFLSRKVFLLSLSEFGQSSDYANPEGGPLDPAVIMLLKIAKDSAGTAQAQWTRSPDLNSSARAWLLNASGAAGRQNSASALGTRPAFTLPSSLTINGDSGVYMNTPPTINYSGSTALGNQTGGFTVQYSVSDADSDAVTVTEKLDGVTKRTHTPTLGANQQFQAVLPANFQTVLNGDHTLSIEATDGKAESAPVSITFTKTVYSCSITLSAPLPADDMPTAIRLSISGNIPSDAVWTAEVCNNGNDASPVWENITPAIQGGYNYPFTNTTKTADAWGVNFRVSFSRGGSNTGGSITSIEGGFQ